MRDSRVLPAVGLAVGLCCALFSPPAQAAPPGPGVTPLHLLELATDDADDQAKAMTLALRGRVRASKDYSLAEGDFSLAVFLAALKCGEVPDATCQTKIADKLGAERYVWGTMRKSAKGEVTADLHLWQKGQPEVRQQLSFSDNMTVPEDAALQRLAEQIFSKMVNFGKVGVAKLSSPQSIAGDLFVDGQGQGKFTNGLAEVTLPVGDHQFEVRSGGKVLAQGKGRVGATTAVEVDLQPLAGEAAPVEQRTAPWKRPAGYAAVGVGGVLVLGAAYMSLWSATNGLGDDSVKQFKSVVRSNEKVCDVARGSGGTSDQINHPSRGDVAKLCDRGDTYKTLQTVFYPLGGLLVAGGAYLLYSASQGSSTTDGAVTAKRRIEVTPMVGQQSGFVDLRVSF